MRTLQRCLQPSEDFQKNFFLAFNGILLFVNPRCGYKPEDPRFYKCTSGSYFKRSFSLLTADGKGKSQIPSGSPGELQTRIRAQPPCQLSPPTLEVLAPKQDLTWHSSPSYPITLFPAFPTNRFLFSAAKIIYWFPLFSLAESSSAPALCLSGQTVYNSAGISSSRQHLAALASFLQSRDSFLPPESKRNNKRTDTIQFGLNPMGNERFRCFGSLLK